MRTVLSLLLAAATGIVIVEANPGMRWDQYGAARDAGWSVERLDEARRFAERVQAGAVLVVQHGRVVAAWGDVARPFRTASVRKSIVATLFGIDLAAGVDLNATIGQLGIDDREPLTDAEKQARVLDLLRARSGIYHPAAKETAQNA